MKLGYFISKRIDQLAKKADISMKNNQYQDAIKHYEKIIDILPEPKETWEAYEWATVSIADTYFIMEDYENAHAFFKTIISTADNPFIILRYGQTQYYRKNLQEAKEYLLKAYQYGGKEIFESEEPMFLNLINENISNKESVFENLFRLPEEYQYLEKEYMSLQHLWKPVKWEEIYKYYTDIFKKIPEELYTNSIAFLCASSILESSVHLNKTEVFSKWIHMLEVTSVKRYDSGVIEVWKGICELNIGNEVNAMQYFKQAVEKGTERVLKNFGQFGNDIYDYYLKNI